MVLFAASLAFAQEAPPPAAAPPPSSAPDWSEVLERSRRTYRTGITIGTLGIAAMAAGTITGATLCVADGCEYGSAGAAVLILGLVGGALAIEAGAPIALAGARRELTALKRLGAAPPIGGSTAVDVGWGCYAGQILFVPLLIGGYVGASVQHADNEAWASGRRVAPGVGLVGWF